MTRGVCGVREQHVDRRVGIGGGSDDGRDQERKSTRQRLRRRLRQRLELSHAAAAGPEGGGAGAERPDGAERRAVAGRDPRSRVAAIRRANFPAG